MSECLPTIIAEIGFNHEGDMDLAVEMIEAAAAAGATAVKFQTLWAEDIALPSAPHFENLKAAEMDLDRHRRLAAGAKASGVEFISTPFSRRAVDYLEEVGVKRYKIASMDLTNTDLLGYVAQTGKPMIVSTGMTTLAEIAGCLEFLTERGAAQVSLLHCISNYPCAANELNLDMIPLLKNIFDVPVGYSDHYPGVKACLAAVMLGAEIIETHFTLDTTKPGADHEHSADPESLKSLIENIRLFGQMRGRPDYLKNRPDRDKAELYRRGLYAAKDLPAGVVLGREDLLFCRPESQLSPNHLGRVLGRKVTRPIKAFQEITWEDL
jgi:sialic acid synthase SpsE